jgi:phytoene dehydrogenase-like protein
MLLEQSERLGGRAGTKQEQGYFLNLGPHALHERGPAARTFRQWGIPFAGRPPDTSAASFLVRDQQMYPLVYTTRGLLTTRLFGTGEKLQAALALKQLVSGDASEGESIQEWIERRVRSQRVRQLVTMLVRTATFSADLSVMSARAALDQFQSATNPGVLYLHEGWQTLVSGLEQRARRLGVEIRLGEPVESLRSIEGDGIVLAVPPESVERITGRSLPAMNPVRLACLDLGLHILPRGAARIALSMDRPLYLSVHSVVARLAPKGSALAHLCKYLDGAGDAAADRRELEEFADLTIPGWRQQAEVVRFLPHLTVTAAAFTTRGRPGIDELKIPGVALAGDWVGTEAMLSDAAVASALRAAGMIERQELRAA